MARKKHWMIVAAAMLSLLLLAGCNQSVRTQGKKGGDKLKVYTSFYPMYDFAQNIGGDRIELVNLVPPGMEPHDWEPAPGDIVNLEKADVFIYNGAGLEHWVDKVLGTLENRELSVVEASHGVALLTGAVHAHEEDHEEEAAAAQAGQQDHDPHVWLNPQNAKLQAQNIKDALVAADPESAQIYTQNYEKYAAQLDQLDQEFRQTLSNLPRKEIVVAHQAFGYLCEAYGLRQEPIEGISSDSEPDPARMAEIIRFAKEHDVRVIFFETMASDKVAKAIANQLGARIDVLSPIEGLSDAQVENGDDYLSVMRQNLKALSAALAE